MLVWVLYNLPSKQLRATSIVSCPLPSVLPSQYLNRLKVTSPKLSSEFHKREATRTPVFPGVVSLSTILYYASESKVWCRQFSWRALIPLLFHYNVVLLHCPHQSTSLALLLLLCNHQWYTCLQNVFTMYSSSVAYKMPYIGFYLQITPLFHEWPYLQPLLCNVWTLLAYIMGIAKHFHCESYCCFVFFCHVLAE